MASVHGVLAASPAPWLLVFDNAPDRASVAPFVPPAGPGGCWSPAGTRSGRPARPWTCRCWTRRWPRSSWSAAPATRTGGRPWSWPVSWAGCRWRWSRPPRTSRPAGTAWPGTWHRSGSGAPDMLGRGEPTGYTETVATTWRLAFEDLQQAAPGAAGLLRLLAFCAPEAIPLRLLLQPRPGLAGRLGEEVAPVLAPLLEDPLAAGDAIAALRRYSLVTPAADGSVSVHRLVQAVTADQMPAELASQWRQAAAALIEAAIPGDTEPPGTWPACAALLPHAQAALADDSDGMARIANYLGSSGSYAAARDLQQQSRLTHGSGSSARSTRTPWPPAQPRPLDREAGDPAAARDLFAALLPVRERVLGPEHPDTLTARARPRPLDRGGGGCGRRPGPVRRAAAGARAGPRPGAPGHPDHPRQPRPLDRGGGGSGRRPGPVRRAAARARAGPRPGAPGHPDRPARPRPLDRGGGGPGRRPGPVRRAAARARAGPRPGAPGHPDRPRATSPAGPGRRGIRPPPGTSSPRCCPSRERVLGPEHPDTLTARAQPRPLDRGGGGRGRRPGPVRRAAARARAGPRPGAPGHPDHPRRPRLLDQGGRAWPCWRRDEVASACSLAPGSQVSPADQRRITGGARASRLWFIYDIPPCP